MNIISQLKRDEGLRLEPYQDSVGIWTIGYGHNLESHGGTIPDSITQAQADQWLMEDVANVMGPLFTALPWVERLDDARQGVFINMSFNLGLGGLLEFHHMLNFAQYKQWLQASIAMLDSKWARQVGARAQRLASQLELGVWQ